MPDTIDRPIMLRRDAMSRIGSTTIRCCHRRYLRYVFTMDSLLARASRTDVQIDPFPHVVIADALPAPLYRTLSDEFPAATDLGENERRNLKASAVVGDRRVSETWRAFVDYHTSPDFMHEVHALFRGIPGVLWGSRLPREFPRVRKIGRGSTTRDQSACQMRYHAFADMDVATQAGGIADQEPIGPHTDVVHKMFSCLFYLRADDDQSTGGALYLSRWSVPGSDQEIATRQSRGEIAARSHTTIVRRVPYASNVAVIFPNSIRAVHGVDLRHGGRVPRRFCFMSLTDPNWNYTRPSAERRVKLCVGRALRTMQTLRR